MAFFSQRSPQPRQGKNTRQRTSDERCFSPEPGIRRSTADPISKHTGWSRNRDRHIHASRLWAITTPLDVTFPLMRAPVVLLKGPKENLLLFLHQRIFLTQNLSIM